MLTPWKKRFIALGLWVPLGLYVAQLVVETVNRSATSIPVPKLPERDVWEKKSAETKARAGLAKAELEAAARFEVPAAKGSFQGPLENRAWALENARLFLAPGTTDQAFGGEKKEDFRQLYNMQAGLRRQELRLDGWLNQPVSKGAVTYLAAFQESYLKPYREAGAAPEMLIKYELRARHKIAIAFGEDLGKQYDDFVKKAGIPLDQAEELVGLTNDLLKMHSDYNTVVSPLTPAERDSGLIHALDQDMTKGYEDWTARSELLVLFAEDPVKLVPARAAEWFKDVNTLYVKLKVSSTKKVIETKVQQFCNAFLPNKLALDEIVLVGIDKRTINRTNINVRYKYNAAPFYRDPEPVLTDDPTRLNERTAEKYQVPADAIFDRFTRNGSPVDVEPTSLTKASFAYLEARQDVLSGGWTRGNVSEMIVKANKSGLPGPDNAHVWNQLSLVGVKGEYMVYKRLKIVEKALKDYPDLFPNR